MRKIAEASKPVLHAKNLSSSQPGSSASLKVTNKNAETSESSSSSTATSTTVTTKSKNNVQQDPSSGTHREPSKSNTVTLDPTLIATIHANNGAIEIIRGQITELRHDVDQLRKQIQSRKRSTTINPNPATVIPNSPTAHNYSKVAASTVVLNNDRTDANRPKANGNDSNPSSFAHHHHHHHHIQQPNAVGRSTVCAIL